jgi:hypothetical protein
MEDQDPDAFLRRAMLFSFYEYCLIVLPVALYVFLVAIAADKPFSTFVHSPEWNIATVFLVAQGQSLYRLELDRLRRRTSSAALGLIALSAIVTVVLAASNIHFGLRSFSVSTMICMWLLFIAATAAFLSFVTGATLLVLKAERGADA